MKGGPVGININSIHSILPEVNKPKTHSAIVIEKLDDPLIVEGTSAENNKRWSEQLFYRDAIAAGYFDAEDDAPDESDNSDDSD